MKKKISDLADIILGYSFREKLLDDMDGNISVIQPKNISEDWCADYNELVKVKQALSKTSNVLQAKDVLITNRGRFISSMFCLKNQEVYLPTSGIFIIRINTESVIPEYINVFLNSTIGQKQIFNSLETTTIPFLNKTNVSEIQIPLLSIKDQKDIVEKYQDFKKYNKLIQDKLNIEKNIVNTYIDKMIYKGAN